MRPPPTSVALSVVVPTYGGAASLPELCTRVAQMARAQRLNWELWVIDDHSPDHTAQVMAAIVAAEPNIQYKRLERNVGQHPATVAGLQLATGQVRVTMDDDLQQAPESIPLLLAALKPGVEVVIARFPNPAHPAWRQLGSQLLHRWARLRDPGQALSITSFKAFTGRAADTLAQATPSSGKFYLSAVLQQVVPRSQIINVDVPHYKRRHGSSSYGPLSLLRLSWRAVSGRS